MLLWAASLRSPGYVGECVFWPSLNDSEKFLTISIFPGQGGADLVRNLRFGHCLGYPYKNNDDDGQLVMRVMMTTRTKMTMTMVVVMKLRITKLARDHVEVPLLWSLPRACSVLSRGQARTESSSSSVVVGYYYLFLLILSEKLEVPSYSRKATCDCEVLIRHKQCNKQVQPMDVFFCTWGFLLPSQSNSCCMISCCYFDSVAVTCVTCYMKLIKNLDGSLNY